MLLHNKIAKKNIKDYSFVFCIPEFNFHSNGIKILYEAAFLFSKYFETTIITFNNGDPVNDDNFKKTPKKYLNLIKDGLTEFKKHTIFIYPDSLTHDPFGYLKGKKIVRFLLSKPFILNGISPRLNNDFCIGYSKIVSQDIPNYFIIDPDLISIQDIDKKKSPKKKLVIYLGKVRKAHFNLKPFVPLLCLFDEYELISRLEPENKTDLFKLIASAHLLISLDAMTSIIHESILLGTPCLIADDIFEKEYKKFNTPLSDLYFPKDIDKIIRAAKSQRLICDQKKNFEIYKKTILKNKIETKSIIFKIITHFEHNVDNNKINEKYHSSFYDFYLKKWGSTPILNITRKRHIAYFIAFSENEYLLDKLYNIWSCMKRKEYIKAISNFGINPLRVKFSKYLYIGFMCLVKEKFLKVKFTDAQLINLMAK